MIGLGLGDAKDITLRGLEAVKKCDKVYLEGYTSVYGSTAKDLSKFFGKEVIEADRESRDAVQEAVKKPERVVQQAMAPIQKQVTGAAVQVTKKADVATPGLTAWVAQIASFNAKDKAQALRDTLRKQGFNAFMEGVTAKNKQVMYRVRIGPEPDRGKAETLLQQVQEKTGLKGFVTSYP